MHEWQKYLNKQTKIESISNDGIVALDKPVSILSHPNIDGQPTSNALFTCPYSLKQEAYYLSSEPVAYLLNRLDSPVSGIILVGLNLDVSQSVRHAFQEKTVKKRYLALLKGHLLHKRGTWYSKLKKVKDRNTVRAEKYGENIAVTEYRLIQEFSWHSCTLSFVELCPVTGRTHQLRLHCAENFVPIIGDKTYGDFKFNKKFVEHTDQKRLFLHSNEVLVRYNFWGQKREFHAQSSYNLKNFCTNVLNS